MHRILTPTTVEFGVVGHAGCGHANSHCGFIQDDSGGLAGLLELFRRWAPVDLRIRRVDVKTGLNGFFEVETAAGGVGRASARRGITPDEARLAQHVVGRDAVCTQALAVEAFGRMLGQGAMEVPVALQTAIANAAVMSLKAAYPDNVVLFEEGVEGNCGWGAAAAFEVDGAKVGLMALVNATTGGLGPNEDVEGNVNLFGKNEVMARFGLDRVPTLLVEGKVCAQPISSEITEPVFIIRAHEGDDNTVVADAYLEGARRTGLAALYKPALLARSADAMASLTRSMGEKLEALGRELAQAQTSAEKVRIAAEVNRFASEDLGGITFMSTNVHQVMGGVGQIPGTTACVSLFIPNEALRLDLVPKLTDADAKRFGDLLEASLDALVERRGAAYAEFERNHRNPLV